MNEHLEFRSAELADVSTPKRIATVIVTPYDTPAVVQMGPTRSFTEIVTRGAYDGVQTRAGRIRANRDHNWERMAGRVIALYPERDEGLVAEVRMAPTDIGNETLELCREEMLSVSAGFGLMREGGATGPVKPGAERWENNRTVRRLNELWLDHVSFVPNPVYEQATVIDVRRAEQEALLEVAATPNRDRIELERLRTEMAALNSRWCV